MQLMRRVLTYPCHKRTLFLHMKAIFQRVSSREWILRRSVSTERRWLSHDFPQYSNEKQKRVWGTLTPKRETRINLKGGGVTLKGFLLTKKLKPERGKEIHDLGYT